MRSALLTLLLACGGPPTKAPASTSPAAPAPAPAPAPVAEPTCRNACIKFFTLLFREDHEPKIAAAPPADQPAMRAKLEEGIKAGIAEGADRCAKQCEAADKPDAVRCIMAAETAGAARACMQ